MNKEFTPELKRLAEEAGFTLWENEEWNPGDVVDWAVRYDDELVKFAQLIVIECSRIADDWVNDKDNGKNYPSEMIKARFGVRE